MWPPFNAHSKNDAVGTRVGLSADALMPAVTRFRYQTTEPLKIVCATAMLTFAEGRSVTTT